MLATNLNRYIFKVKNAPKVLGARFEIGVSGGQILNRGQLLCDIFQRRVMSKREMKSCSLSLILFKISPLCI